MNKKFLIFISMFLMASVSFSMTQNPWTLEASLGIGHFNQSVTKESNAAFGRLSIGHILWNHYNFQLGVGLGVQSGSTLRLNLPQKFIDELGGVAIDAQVKPMIDALVTLRTNPLRYIPLNAFIKGGVAYRTIRINVHEIDAFSQISPELQAGLCYQLNEQTSVNLGYQILLGSPIDSIFSIVGDAGQVRGIPQVQGLLFGLSFNFM